MLEIKNLTILFSDRQTEPAVENFSLTVCPGQKVALVGESGSGKTIIALSCLKLLQEGTLSGQILFQEEDILNMSQDKLLSLRGQKIAMVFQEPMSALNPLHKVKKQIRGINTHTSDAKVADLLKQVDLSPEDTMHKYPHQLSGGQRQRVMIAMAIAAQPQLLIADEPTTALDGTTQKQILNLLRKLCDERSMALLLVSHDLEVVSALTDDVYIIQRGSLVEHGTTQEIFQHPKTSYTRHLIDVLPKEPLSHFHESVVMSVKNLTVSYPVTRGFFRKKYTALYPISFSIKKGETMGVFGKSGSGKTTLALGLLRLVDVQGRIMLDGCRFDTLTGRLLQNARRHLQIVFQDPFTSLSPHMRVEDIVAEGLYTHEHTPCVRQKVIKVFDLVGISQQSLHRYPHEFSGGQRQRIALARVLILNPKVLILDEPTSSLDRSIQSEIIDLLICLQRDLGLSYLFISHNRNLVKHMCHHVLVLESGKCLGCFKAETF